MKFLYNYVKTRSLHIKAQAFDQSAEVVNRNNLYKLLGFKLIILTGLLIDNTTFAIETIKINKGHHDPIPIALQVPKITYIEDERVAKEVFSIVQTDLEHSGGFKILPRESFVDKITGIDYMPNFQAWQIINAQFLLNSEIQVRNRSEILIKLVLYDVVSQRVFAQKVYESSMKNLRKLSHIVSNFLYEKTTGNKGYFNSKLAYVDANYRNGKRVTRIAVMDYDGYNLTYVTNGKNLVLTPRFSKDGSNLAYVSFVQKVPRVVVKNLYSGKESFATDLKAMSSAPRFAPDGKKMLITISERGRSNIFEVDLFSHKYTQLTNNQYINTSSTYNHNGNRIYFNSDMAGKINIYSSDRSGVGSYKIGQGGGNYFTPIESPNGDYVAATKVEGGQFSIVVMNPDGSGERKITEGFLVESPSFAPNSNLIAFTKEEKSRIESSKNKKILVNASYIYAIDVTGRYMRKINTPGFGFDPEWSCDLSDQPDFWKHP